MCLWDLKEDVKLMEINAHYAPCYVCDLNVSVDYNIKVQNGMDLEEELVL